MVQAVININEQANRILNIIKAKFDLRDKSEAINLMAEKYGEEILEPELRPEWIKKMQKRQLEPTVKIGTLKNFRKHFGLK